MEKTIQLSHGGGGKSSSELIEQEILSRFKAKELKTLPDAATLANQSTDLVFSTDSFVVTPHFFPGGDIGKLAVYGTVNDISVAGGDSKYLSLGLILEEGFSIDSLKTILDSVKKAAEECAVTIVTGDTKVVPRGHADGIYINTAGIGFRKKGIQLGSERIKLGDKLIISGSPGDHGFAILAERNNIKSNFTSDCGSLQKLCHIAAKYGEHLKFMRDPTRGGLASVLNEIINDSIFGITIDEANMPRTESTKALSEMLGIDYLHVASEGRLILIVSSDIASDLVSELRKIPEGKNAAVIGVVTDSGNVTRKLPNGLHRLVEMPHGEILPRIC